MKGRAKDVRGEDVNKQVDSKIERRHQIDDESRKQVVRTPAGRSPDVPPTSGRRPPEPNMMFLRQEKEERNPSLTYPGISRYLLASL